MDSEATIATDRWLRHLKRFLKVARTGIDPEGVHQVRVATRRLDVWLILGGWRVYRDDLRWLRRRASAVRDIDVLLGRKGLPRMTRAAIISWKRESHAEFRLACDDGRLSALMVGLGAMPPIDQAEATRQLPKILDDVLQAGAKVEKDDMNIASFHRLRRAARRLRYALEAVEASTSSLKKLQVMLGEVNDLAVARRCLDHLPAEKVPTEQIALLHDELAFMLPRARELWREEKNAIGRMVS